MSQELTREPYPGEFAAIGAWMTEHPTAYDERLRTLHQRMTRAWDSWADAGIRATKAYWSYAATSQGLHKNHPGSWWYDYPGVLLVTVVGTAGGFGLGFGVATLLGYDLAPSESVALAVLGWVFAMLIRRRSVIRASSPAPGAVIQLQGDLRDYVRTARSFRGGTRDQWLKLKTEANDIIGSMRLPHTAARPARQSKTAINAPPTPLTDVSDACSRLGRLRRQAAGLRARSDALGAQVAGLDTEQGPVRYRLADGMGKRSDHTPDQLPVLQQTFSEQATVLETSCKEAQELLEAMMVRRHAASQEASSAEMPDAGADSPDDGAPASDAVPLHQVDELASALDASLRSLTSYGEKWIGVVEQHGRHGRHIMEQLRTLCKRNAWPT